MQIDPQKDSFLKKIKNPRWRLNNLYQIINKNSRRVKFKENSCQKIVNDILDKHRRSITLKTRQVGITTNDVLRQFDKTIFSKNFTACILAHEDDAITKIFNIPRNAYKWTPENFKPKLDRGGSKYEMYFPDINSRIYCDLESRGDTINWLHVSEAAFMEKERLNATLQAVPIDGIVTIETTANGLENFFYEMWDDDSEHIYKKIFLPWFLHDEYKIEGKDIELTYEELSFIEKANSEFGITISKDQIAYRRFKKGELKSIFAQEYPEDDITCFMHSGRTVVDQVFFKKLYQETKPILREEKNIQFYDFKNNRKDYVIGADVSQGIGGDFSVASVFCIQDMEEVAFFRGQLSPGEFAKKLEEIAHFFSTGSRVPLIAVEINNHGHAVLLALKDYLLYPNLFHAKGKDHPGWYTTSITRPIMIDQLIEALVEKQVKINSKTTLKEMTILVEDRGKIQAPKGKHDDCAIATAIAVQMLLENSLKIKLYENVADDIMVD